MLTETARKSRKKQPPPIQPPPAVWMPAIVLYVLFSVLIVLSARGDLWLDEIWSVDFARSAHSLRELFVRFRHDNNHPLNTVFLYLVRQQSGFLVDRMLSILSGIGALVLCGEWTRRVWGRREGFVTILLAGSSFPLLLYFSEARGYAPAILFALLAFVSLERNLYVFKARRFVAFLVASALGVLSHSTFVIVTIALCVMHGVVVFKNPLDRPRRIGFFLMHQVPALLFPAIWYFLFVRHMEIGGGPVEKPIHVVGQTAAYLLGLSVASPWLWVALGLALLAIFWGSRRLKRDGRGEWIFFPAMLVLAPVLVLALARPKYLYFRYFILCFPFFYMLLGYTLGRATTAWGRSTRWMPWLVVLMLVLGQSTRVEALVQEGRGHYAAAWARIVRDTASQDIYVGSDHDFRNRLVLTFYASRDPLGKLLYYVPQTDWSRRPPDWVLITQGQEFSEPPDEIPFKDVGVYRFVASYDSAPVSGWGWFLFRKQ